MHEAVCDILVVKCQYDCSMAQTESDTKMFEHLFCQYCMYLCPQTKMLYSVTQHMLTASYLAALTPMSVLTMPG